MDLGAPSLTGGQGAVGEQVFVLPFDVMFGACTPAVVLRHRFAKNVNISISFKSTLFDSEPSSEQRNRKSFIGTAPLPGMTPGSRKLVAKKTGAEPLVWLPLTSPPQ